jgi:NACHT domain
MQRKIIIMVIVAFIVILLTVPCILLRPTNTSASTASSLTIAVSPTTTSSQTGSAQSAGSINPAVLAALIGLAGVIVVAFISGMFVLYQVRRNTQLEREKQEEQFRHDEEMARLQKELELQYKAKEQEQQQEATKAEALRLKMLLDQTNSERATTYRQSLHADPRISHLQILDMNRPLEVTSIYVRVRVHQDTRTSYELDQKMRSAEALRDPNTLLLTGFKNLEQRASSSVDPDEAIRTYKHCIIVGDPGAGKTTLLKYLTLKAADGQLIGLPDLPIRIELNAFATSGYQELLDFAASEWDSRYNFPKAEAHVYMEERLQAGEALLLLDALDETVIGDTGEAAESSYLRVVNAIMQVTTRYHRSPIVVTARKAGYQQRVKLVGFTELEVLDFRPEDIRRFVTNWFNCYQDEQKRANAIALNTKLEHTPRIQSLAANPLLLSLIVLVYEAELDLPDRRAELYKQCVDTLLTEWDATRNIRRRREFKPEHKRQLLAELAWHFHQQGRRYFPVREVLTVIAHFLPRIRLLPEQSGQILAEIANEQGVLKEQAKGWQGFLHLTLQEYFVAQFVTDHQKLDILLTHRGDPWWEEVLLLYAGYIPDASLLLHKLLEHDEKENLKDDLFYTDLLLAGQCLAARPTIQDVSLWDTIITHLFEILTTTPYSLTRQQMAETLFSIGGAEINKHLLMLLSNRQINRDVRSSIASALGQLGERSVAHDLVPLLSNKQIDTSVRTRITVALGMLINDEMIVHSLAELISKSDIADDIHRVLWSMSRQAGVRIYLSDGPKGKHLEIVKWSSA